MKIMVVMAAPKGTLSPAMEERMAKTVLGYSGDGIDMHVGYPAESSGFVPRGGDVGNAGMARNHLLIAERMVQGEAEGMDACIPYGMMEFGVDIARGRCKIPIVGQARAAYCTAALMVDRFGIITYNKGNSNSTWRQLRDQGFLDQVSGMGAVGMPTSEMWDRSPVLYERFVAEGKRLVSEGAELIVCHGMSMSPLEYSAGELGDGIGVPVIEGMGSAIALAQAWHRLGTPYSSIRYSSR